MVRSHLFTERAEQALQQALKRLAMAVEDAERANQALLVARTEVAEAVQKLSLEKEADLRSAADHAFSK